tara:strand:+ start:531 stop:836 length:306 start_codon:yes stop_codon:yes gene_type:complete
MACILVKIHKSALELELCLFKDTFVQNEKFFLDCARKSGLGGGVSFSDYCGNKKDFCTVDIYYEQSFVQGEYEGKISKNEIADRLDKFIKLISKKFHVDIR